MSYIEAYWMSMGLELRLTIVSLAVALVVVGIPVLVAVYLERKQRGL